MKQPRKLRSRWEPKPSITAAGHGAKSGCDDDRRTPLGVNDHGESPKPSVEELRDLGGALPVVVAGEQPREGDKPYDAVAHACDAPTAEKSDASIVPSRLANARVTPAESAEGRCAAKGKPAERNTSRTLDRADVLTMLERVRQRAVARDGKKFTNLVSHIKVPLLREAFSRLRKAAAPGVDGQTWSSYAEDLEARLLDLQDRVQRGSYHPQPVRRVHIPKGDGRTRPLGIPALEDKIVQQAARMLLEPIYESEFVGFSYGFRPGRSQHGALDALFAGLYGKVDWVLDADIRSFYDTIDHGWLQKFVEHRIGDRRMVRLLVKWLHAGVMEDGEFSEVTEGTPQGGVISPLLANIFLHYALDLWAQQWGRREARGEIFVVRYADDFVMGFQHEQDARAMRAALAERLAKFGLQLHPDKTHVIRFGRFAHRDCTTDGLRRPETFDFLGFTHICAKGPDGRYRLVRRTSRKKRMAKLKALQEQMRRRRHEPLAEQHRWLASVLRGHYNYYAVPGNFAALKTIRDAVRRGWHRALQRRSQRARFTARKRARIDERFPLPPPRIVHPHPFDRLKHRPAALLT